VCRRVVDIQSPTAEIRRGKEEERTRRKKQQLQKIMSASATRGGHNYCELAVESQSERTASVSQRSANLPATDCWFFALSYTCISNMLLQICLIGSAKLTSRTAVMMMTITSGQRNLTKGRIAAAHGWFNGIQQVARVCTPSDNVSRVSIQNSILFQPFLHSPRQSFRILYNGTPLPPRNFPFQWGSRPHLICGSFSTPESRTHAAFRSV